MPLSTVLGAQSLVQPAVCTTATRPASPYTGQAIYDTTVTQVLVWNGTAWATVGPPQTAIFTEYQAGATNGGTIVATTFTKRTLNTTIVNEITGCSIASSVITLPAGTFLVNASSPFYRMDGVTIRLRNTSDSTNTIIGTAEYVKSTTMDVQTRSFLQGQFTIASSKNFEVQYWAETNSGSGAGLGVCNGAGIGQVYTSIQITKVA
jgi:hypothetical protein